MPPHVVDLFSGGGGGWCLAASALGLPCVGIEIDGPSCATRAVVGLATIRADVSTYPAEVFAGKVEGLCGSPPCQSFSSAGKGKGLDDPRGQLVHEPMRYVRACGPRWVALEQVPEVLGYWRWIARELTTMGYSTWAGILNAADYGVPQIRKRAILLASLDRRAEPPAPTHSKHGHDDLFGGGLAKWVTMAEALGAATEPAPTVALGHNAAAWCWERPATTVQCDPRIAQPGHKGDKKKERNAVRQMANAIPVEPWELGVLQGFPADHPWQPPRVSAQIGNAIPPPLALACLSAITGADRAGDLTSRAPTRR